MEGELEFKDLTLEERKLVCNGCGGKGGWFDPPEYRFHASCNLHDFKYWVGCTDADRKKADEEFYAAMLEDAKRGKNAFRRWWLRRAAQRYYWAVRWFGGKYFHKAMRRRGRVDLEVLKELEAIKTRAKTAKPDG